MRFSPRWTGVASLLAALVVAIAILTPAAHAESALFDLNRAGPQEVDGDTAAVELGTRMTVDAVAYVADGVTFYRPPGHEASNVLVHLWEDGKVVRSGVTGTSPTGGWVHVRFAEGAFLMTPGHDYVSSYAVPSDESYVATTGFFSEPYAPSVLGLRVPEDGGVYRYLDGGPATVPADTWDASNYWVSVYGDSLTVRQGFGSPFSLFDATSPITERFSDDTQPVELGVRFRVDQPVSPTTHYELKAVRYYRDQQHGIMENHVTVYDGDGQVLARGFAEGEGPRSGIVDVLLDHVVRLVPGQTYTVSYLAPDGGYPENQRGFAIGGQMGAIHYPADAGVYRYGGGYPTDTWESDDYYVSPLVATVSGA